MKYRLLYNKITVVALSAMLSLSAVSCGKLDASKLDGNALPNHTARNGKM